MEDVKKGSQEIEEERAVVISGERWNVRKERRE